MDTQNQSRQIAILCISGALLQYAGVSEWLVVYLVGSDLGINWAFWYRFVCNIAGLTLLAAAIILIAPKPLRALAILGLSVLIGFVVLQPGYYRVFGGPLAEYRVTPIEFLKRPYEPPVKTKPHGKPGPELAKNDVHLGT